MKRLRSLRTRLILTFAGLIVAGFAILAIVAGGQISQGAWSDYEERLETQTILVSNGLGSSAEHLVEGEITPSDFARIVATYAGQTGARLTIIGLDGQPWLDSTGELPSDFNPDQPEIVTALSGHVSADYRKDSSGTLTLYSAALLRGDEDPVGLVRLSMPASGPESIIMQRWLELGAGVLTITAAALAASLLLARSLARPLEALRQSALRLAGGDLAHRIEQPGGDEIGQLGQAFNHLATQVQSMLDEQRAFASNASHELRTPLTAIRVRSEALRGQSLDEATRARYVTEIDDEAARLGRLVEDLILLYRFDTGRVEPGREMIDPGRFAHEMARDFEQLCKTRGLSLTVDIVDGLPPVHASLGHLKVVFRNLLDNAIKYTANGGAVTWRLWREDKAMVSTMTDNGRGISAEDLPHIFEPFFRGDKAHSRSVQGVGLGLSLTRSVVRFYGGDIVLLSDGDGRGTTARIWWPFGTSSDSSRSPHQEQ